jgi:RNA polymerase sigma-70 factor (ECF subfamily)
MLRWRNSGSDELQALYRGNVDAAYAFFAYSVDASTAEDLTAATFERVVRNWHRFDAARGSQRTWVLSIARNILIDHYRAQSHRRSISADEHPEVLDALTVDEDPLARALSEEELKTLLSPLQPREREVLALRYGADLGTKEIASLLDLSTANVHQLISRSLRRLRAVAEVAATDHQSPAP